MRRPRANEIVWGGGVLGLALLCGGFFATCTRSASAAADLLDRDPCAGWERKPGCAERETAGDRWSRDQLRASVPRKVAEEVAIRTAAPQAECGRGK